MRNTLVLLIAWQNNLVIASKLLNTRFLSDESMTMTKKVKINETKNFFMYICLYILRDIILI